MATFSNMIFLFLCCVFFVSAGSSDPFEDDVETDLTNDMNLFSSNLFNVSAGSSAPLADVESELTESINLFTSDLFKVISNDKDYYAGKNLIISAMSADMVLAMLSLGAKGKTLDEINAGLYLPNSSFTKAAYMPAIDKMNDYTFVTLHLAFKVYISEKYELNPLYKTYVTHYFGSEVESIDFGKNAEAAAKINSWVEEKTVKTIKKIVKADEFDKNTSLILVNTIYFKGKWENQFSPYNTKKDSFNVSATKQIQIPMMFQENYTKYAESAELDAKMLELNFEGEEMTMVFILPNEVDGLAALEEELIKNYTKLKDMYDSLQTQNVTMLLPRFKIETAAELTPYLTDLGIKTMFTNDADLSGLLANNPLPLKANKVTHKAYIDVNEKGVTAGAATDVEFNLDTPNIDILFNANHPFCFGLVNSDGQIVFSGHFTGEK